MLRKVSVEIQKIIDSIPEATASSTTYWISGLSTKGNISFGCAFVAGKNLVPNPAAGKTALRTLGIISLHSMCFLCRHPHFG